MAWWEREYTRRPTSDLTERQGFRWPPIGVRSLLVLHFAAVLAAVMSRQAGSIAPLALAGDPTQFWTILTHPFALGVLDSPLGVFFALALLTLTAWTLGDTLERRLGTQALIRSYILGNVAAGIACYLAVLLLGGQWNPLTYPVGALAAWALLGWRHLRYDMVLVLGRLTNSGVVVAVTGGIIVMLQIFSQGRAATGWVTAVAAGAASALLSDRLADIRFRAPRRRQTPRVRPRVEEPRRPDEPDIDDILDKIHRLGMASLTDEEKQRLDAARRAKLEH